MIGKVCFIFFLVYIPYGSASPPPNAPDNINLYVNTDKRKSISYWTASDYGRVEPIKNNNNNGYYERIMAYKKKQIKTPYRNKLSKYQSKYQRNYHGHKLLNVTAVGRHCNDTRWNILRKERESFKHCCNRCTCICDDKTGGCGVSCTKLGCGCDTCKKGECNGNGFPYCDWHVTQECITKRRPAIKTTAVSSNAGNTVAGGPEESPACSNTPEQGQLFSSHHFFEEIGFGNNPPSGKQEKKMCNYTMTANNKDSVVKLRFYIFDIGYGWSCNEESVTVYDSNGTAIHKYCGVSSNILDITSSGDKLTISHQFPLWSRNGFLAEWTEVRKDEKRENTYLITYPHTFLENSVDTVCIEVFSKGQERGNGIIIVNIFIRNPIKETPSIVQQEQINSEETTKCLSIRIPKKLNVSSAFIEFVGHFKNYALKIKALKKINIIKEETLFLIQTDKGQYKPKDTIKFRILLVNNHLKTANIEMVEEIWVEDAVGWRIEQWKKQPLDKGILQKQFTLSDEPQLGTWTIHFKTGKMKGIADFVVSEHILPKFELKIDPPAAVLRDAREALWQVCGVYTHGGPVLGSVTANFTSSHPIKELDTTVQILEKINSGENCAKIVLNRKQLQKITNDGRISDFIMNVELEEAGTSIKVTSSRREYLQDKPIKIDTNSSSTPFILGVFPYIGEFKVTNHNGTSRSGEELEVCARLFRDISAFRFSMWAMDEDEILELGPKLTKLHYRSHCQRFKTDIDGKLKFFVPSIDVPEDVVKLSIKVIAINFPKNETTKMNQPLMKLDVPLIHINSTLAASFQEIYNLMVSCDKIFTSKIYFSNKPGTNIDFYYKIISNGKIFKSDTVSINMGHIDSTDELVGNAQLLTTQPNHEAKQTEKILKSYNITIPIDYKLSPIMNLIVFTKDKNGTIVSTSHEYNVKPCQKHKVSGKLSKEKVYPGTPVSYSVLAGSKSLCGLSATDKSIELLGNNNKVTSERVSQLQARVNNRKSSPSSESHAYYHCPQTKQFVQHFSNAGINIVSDLSIIQSCKTVTDGFKTPDNNRISGGKNFNGNSNTGTPALGARAPGNTEPDEKIEEPSISLRNFFPETWLFELVNVKDGHKFNLTSPHTITEWEVNSFCINDENGLGVAKPQPLLVSQDFFAELNLPYSVKRGEGFPLNISIFNNVEGDLPIRVTVKNNVDEVMLKQNRFDLCISPKSNQAVSIKTTARKLGNINVTVEAKITNGISGCKNVSQGEGFTDALVRPLLVKPEGFLVEKVQSEFICINEDDSLSTAAIRMSPLTLPSDTVPDSERAWIYVTGDIMAPSLENPDNLVNLPTGCGEQNMARLAPNIYLLQYLAATGKREPELERKAKMYIRIGYARQQGYRHHDGSYSIWGKGNGSTWLTAFVVKTFSEAFPLISQKDMQESIQQSVDWLMKDQKEDGCFLRKGFTHSSNLKGGANEDSLTPFVILSLLQTQENMRTNVDEKKLMKAVNCMLNSFNSIKLYSASLTTYTANLLNKVKKLPPKIKQKIQSLWPQIRKAANTSIPGALFWNSAPITSNHFYSRSKSVEITAYNILTMTLLEQLSDAVRAAKWLARQRNSNGGFISTQDTVVALQALSAYTQKVSHGPLNMHIDIKENHASISNLHKYRITSNNALLLQTQRISKLPSKISITPSGSGCALVQTVLRYNQQTSQNNQGFTINVQIIQSKVLQICYKYTGSNEKTDMAVIEVELVTGWDAHNLDALLNRVGNSLQRFEKEEDKIVLYFDEMTKNGECLEMEVRQTVIVEDPNSAIVKIYDYYNTEDTVSIQYHM